MIFTGAIFSDDRIYRYRLGRHWGPGSRTLCWVMLNPSTADEATNDPTIRKCIGFAKKWNFDGIDIVNLFAYRATNPKGLIAVAKQRGSAQLLEGQFCNHHILDAAKNAGMTVCAWGNHGRINCRGSQIAGWLSGRHNIELHCLKISKENQPVHPLYQPYSLEPQLLTRGTAVGGIGRGGGVEPSSWGGVVLG